jgi:hypothetical protein
MQAPVQAIAWPVRLTIYDSSAQRKALFWVNPESTALPQAHAIRAKYFLLDA